MAATTTAFGVSLLGLTQQPVGEDMAARSAETLRWVHHARDHGFDYLTTGQHFLTTPLQQLQAVPVLARLIPESGRMRLAPTLLAPLHNPVDLAETLGSLDVLSGGRLTLSFALGYRDEEYLAFGVRRAERVERMAAVIRTLRALWSGEEVSSDEPWWQLRNAKVTLRPAQRPHPPIWIAANADAAITRAARWGLPWNINAHADLTTVARQVRLYRAAAAAAGHDPDIALPIEREMYCGSSQETAFQEAGPYLAAKYDSYARWGQHKALPGRDDFTAPVRELSRDRFIVGDAEHCASEVRRYLDLGIGYAHFRMNWPGMPLGQAMDSMSRFAEQVLPEL
ncbi:LLM class flavin-dependent oxidoreductase [Saccharopolyspora sp. K220]|uniref:LLM class flavin-dependent oxidoreductase n=1 Tax=Saccharopolyspora soli TaxID=2926618 RepID=UPI001F5A3DF3|nr:LLM class flavin-dependent oxidoreductase [Saccharopolyspora soli]MCI2419531.1 LLM class flavin-dependent oxidoreductase [Saccharopolyspora soli]